MAKNIIVKFGGSCLSTSASITSAARKIANEVKRNNRIVVVVSALTGITDSLEKMAEEASLDRVSKKDMDEILSMGERTAARLMTSALNAFGLKAVGLDPSSNLWPIYTDSKFGGAEIDLERTTTAVERKIKPLLEEGYVVVVPGFIGLSLEGEVTTLGRGGSDITAVVLGRCLGFDEAIFVKDVNGILSADPKKVPTPARIEMLDAEEMFNLSSAGAKVLHPKSLKYKTQSLNLRVVGFDEEDLSSAGTLIKGALQFEMQATLYAEQLSMITIIGQEVSTPTSLQRLLTEAQSLEAKILGITLASPSLLLYIQNPTDLIQRLHSLIKNHRVAKVIHSIEPIAMIHVTGHGLEESPGVVDAIAAPLAKQGINLYGILTIQSSVRVFVPWEQRDKALNLIEESLNKLKDTRRKS